MKESISSAGLVYLYLNGYLKNDRLYTSSVDTYQYMENEFYQRVIEKIELTDEFNDIVHIFAVIGVKEKADQVHAILEGSIKDNFKRILDTKKIKKSNNYLDKIGNAFFRCIQEFFYEQLNHLPKRIYHDFNNFIIGGICCSRLPDDIGDSITNEIISLWLEQEKPALCGKQLMTRSFFVRDFVGRKVITSIPKIKTGSWRIIFEGGHQLLMDGEFSYLKETLDPNDLGAFCSSNLQSIFMNPIYAYGQWFQPNDVCEEWHKVFLYLCAISDSEWNETNFSNVYDKFLDFLQKNICITTDAPPFISKSQYYKILLINIEKFRDFLKGEDEPVISKDLLQTMNSRYIYLSYLWSLFPPMVCRNNFSIKDLKKQINQALEEKDNYKKGMLWENVAVDMLSSIDGFKITGTRIRAGNQEIDISVANISLDNQLWQLGAYILVECKNWSSRVDLHQIRNIAHISNMKGNKTALLFTANGITSDAQNEIHRLVAENCFIICITANELLQITNTKEYRNLILNKWNNLNKNIELTSIL